MIEEAAIVKDQAKYPETSGWAAELAPLEASGFRGIVLAAAKAS